MEPDFLCLADEKAEPRPDMNIKVAVFTVSETSINTVLDLRLRGRCLETHHRHCVVSLSKTIYPQLSTGSIEEDRKLSNKM